MSRESRRVNLTPGYVLHQRPFRDTSLIADVFTRDHGRLCCFARAARGARPGSRFMGLAPFRPLLLSWSGRGEAPQLTAAEPDGTAPPVPAGRLLSAFYLNELLLKLTVAHDPQPPVYQSYAMAIGRLAGDCAVEFALRSFETQLLEQLGYGIDFGAVVAAAVADDEDCYSYRAGEGFETVPADAPGALPRRVLSALANEEPLVEMADQKLARALMRQALDHCLEGRELVTRKVARAVARLERVA